MKKYATNDGDVVEAIDAADLVTKLRLTARMPVDTDAEYMASAAAWVSADTGKMISADNPDAFVASMKAAGYIKEVE